jgi:hypothetical protein
MHAAGDDPRQELRGDDGNINVGVGDRPDGDSSSVSSCLLLYLFFFLFAHRPSFPNAKCDVQFHAFF